MDCIQAELGTLVKVQDIMTTRWTYRAIHGELKSGGESAPSSQLMNGGATYAKKITTTEMAVPASSAAERTSGVWSTIASRAAKSELTVVLRPPGEVSSSDDEREDEAYNSPRHIVYGRCWWDVVARRE